MSYSYCTISIPVMYILCTCFTRLGRLLFTLRTKLNGAVYYNRSYLWVCVCVCVCLWVCYHDNSKYACIDLHQTGFVGKGSDHLQLIKFWPSRAPGRVLWWSKNFAYALLHPVQTLRLRGLWRGEIFGSALLQPAHSVCVSLSAFFIISL